MTYFLGFIIGFIGLILGIFIATTTQVSLSQKSSALAGIITPLLLAFASSIMLFPRDESMGFWGHLILIVITLIPSFFFMVSIYGKGAEARQYGHDSELVSIGSSGRVNINYVAGISIGGFVSVILFPVVWYFIG